MKVTKEKGQENRAAVLQAASSIMRAAGVAQAGTSEIAAKAGLTHGAIYRHFPSKSALAAAVVTFDFGRITDLLAQDGMSYAQYVQTYLSAQHRDYFPWGCPIGALAGEIGRLDNDVQTAFAAGLQKNIDALARLIGGPDAQGKAMADLAAMAGALAMARAVKGVNPKLSDEILKNAQSTLLAQ